MPVVLRSVLLVSHQGDHRGRPWHSEHCDACSAVLPAHAATVRVRNRSGPGAIRPARLCDACLEAIDRAIDLTEHATEIALEQTGT